MRKALRSYGPVMTCLFLMLAIAGLVTAQPTFTSTPVTSATVGSPYTYGISATEPTNNVVSFTAVTKPSWLTLNSNGQNTAVPFGSTVAQPGGIAGDQNGNIYVTNLGGTGVYKIAPDGTTTLWFTRQGGNVYAMYVYNGFLYLSYYYNSVTNLSCITKVPLANPTAETLVYSSTSNYTYLSMTYNSGFLYIAAYGQNKVIRLNVTTNAVNDVVNVSCPFGIGFSSSGLMYIANYCGGIIYRYNLSTGVLTQAISGLQNCSDVKVDVYDNVYVSGYQFVRKYDPTLTSYVTAYTASGYVWGMSITPSGALVFGDNTGNKVAKLQTGATLSGTPTLADLGINAVTLRASNGTSSVDQSFNITVTSAPTIGTISNITKTFGDATFTLTDPASNSAGTFSYSSSNTSVATISGNTVTIAGAGTTTITATQAAAGFFTSGTKTFTLTVNKLAPTITGFPAIDKVVNSAPFTLTPPTSNSNGTFTYSSSNTSVATISGNTVTLTGTPGTSTITATQATTTNYLAGSTTAVLTVATGVKTGPASINNGILMWLDASDVDADGNAGNDPANTTGLTTWKDKSGNVNNAIKVTGHANPVYLTGQINGKSVMRFTRTTDYIGSAMSAAGVDLRAITNPQLTVFAVYKPGTHASNEYNGVWGNDNANWDRFYLSSYDNGNNSLISLGQNSNPPFAVVANGGVTGSVRLLTAVYKGNVVGGVNAGQTDSSAIYFNGGLVTRFTDGTHATDALSTMGIGWDGDNSAYNGDIAEVIVYNRKLNECEIQEVNKYLALKYGQSFTSAVITPAAAQAICPGSTVTLTASAGASYKWYKDGVLINNATSATYAADAAGSYTAEIISASGCSATSAPTVVTLLPQPVATATDVDVTCSGSNDGSITITATGGTTPYTYSADGGSTFQSSNTFATLTAGNYSVLVKSASGCVSQAITVTVGVQPDVTKPVISCPANITVTAAEGSCSASVNVPVPTATDNCTPAAAIVFSNSINNTPDASGIFQAGATTITWTATDASGNTQTCTQVVTVLVPEVGVTGNGNPIANGDLVPAAADNTSFGTIVSGSNINKTFTIQNTGTAPLTVTSIIVTGANASDFTVSGITYPAVIAVGQSASFTTTFQTAGAGARNAVITVNNSDCDEAAYSFAVTATASCTTPAFAGLDVYIQASTSATTCDAVVTYGLSVSGAPAPGVSYVFSGATTGSGTGTGSGKTFNKGITHVTVTATNACGSQNVAFDVTVVDNVKPVVITKNHTIYLNSAGVATLNAADLNNGSYDNCGTVTFQTNSSGIICATASEGSSLTITAPAGKVINAIDFASYGTPNGSCGNFTIGSCHASNSMSVLSQAIGQNSFTITATNDIFGDPCGGTVKRLYVQASYTSVGTSNTFNCSNLGNNTATLVVTDADGNTASGTATVTVVDAISPTVVTRNLTLCLDANGNAVITPAQINNGSTDNCSGTLTYALDKTTFNTSNVGANTVTLSVTDASGNVGTATAIVTINAVPTAFNVTGGGAYCAGSAGVVVGLAGSTTGINYQLRKDGINTGAAIAGTGSSISFPAQTAAGTYTVFATNTTTACTGTMGGTAAVVVNPKPTIAITPSAPAVCAGSSITLTAAQTAVQTRTYAIPVANLIGVSDGCGYGHYYGGGSTGFFWNDAGAGTVTNVSVQLSVGVECNSIGYAHSVTLNNSASMASFVNNSSSCSCTPRSTPSLYTFNFTPNNYVVGGVNTIRIGSISTFGYATAASLGNAFAIVTVTYNGGAAPAGISNWQWSTGETTSSVTVTPAATGSYSVTGTDANGCTNTLSTTVTVNPLPAIYNMTGGGISGGNTVALGLSGSQTGVRYQLMRGGTAVGTPVNGTGGAISFTPQSVAGIYTAVATNATTNCTNAMNGTAEIIAGIAPSFINTVAAINASVPANACSAVVTYALSATGIPAPAVAYTMTGATTASGTGTGSGVTFNKGVTQVTVTASNFVASPAYSFTVTVTDVTRPTIVAPAAITVNADAGQCGATVTLVQPQASDNCGVASITNNSADFLVNGRFPVGVTTITWTVTDNAGLSETAQQTITVSDTQVPVIVTPAGISVGNDADKCSASVTIPVPAASDNCGVAGVTGVRNDGLLLTADYPVGVTTITWTATDVNGLSSVVTQTVTVSDIQKPVITPGVAITQTADAGDCGANVTVGAPVTADNCGVASVTNSFNNTANASGHYPVGTTVITWTVTDIHGNVQTATQSVNVTDNEKPVITPGAAITQTADAGDCGANVTVGVPVTADNCGVASVTNSFNNTANASGHYPVGTTEITWTVTDIHGNAQTATQSVTVTDNEKPVITPGAAITQTADAGDCGANVTVGVPVTADNCGVASVTNSFNNTANASGHYPVGTTVITWTVTDIHGSVQTATQSVTVTDNEKPVITPGAAITQTADAGDCGANVTVGAPVTADNCGVASVMNSFNNTANASGHYPVGTTVITWTVTDIHGNVQAATQSVTVTDNEKPVITNMPANITVNAIPNNCSTLTGWAKPAASDNCGIASLVSDDNFYEAYGFSLMSVGTHVVTYTATDIHGNKTTASFTVTVVDNQPPVITGCPGNITVNAAAGRCDAVVNWNPPTASDNCPGVSLATTHIQGSVFPVGTTTVTYTATDHVGNTTTCTFNVTVVDAEKPTISIPSVTVNNDAGVCGAVVALGSPVTADNCGVAGVVNNGSADGFYPVGTTNVTWTVTDIHGNSQSYVQQVKVIDNERPAVITQPLTVQLNSQGTAVITPAQVNNGSSDNCGIASLVLDKTVFDCSNIGSNTVILTVTDLHGNTSSQTAEVTVQDNIAPVVVTKNITIYLDANGHASITAADVNNGTSDACGIASLALSQTSFGCDQAGANTVTLTATDLNGNTASETAVVTVKDSVVPVVVTKNATVYLDATGNATIAAADINNGSSDACGIASVAISQSAFNCAQLGQNTVVLTVTDVHGNAATGTAVVTVRDTISPVLNIASLPVMQAECTLTVPVPTATDNCGGVINGITADPLVYTAQGNYTIHWTYTDASGNVTTQNQTVVVKDISRPVLTGTLPGFNNGQCLSDVPAAPSVATIAALYTDNCSPVTAVLVNSTTTGANDTGWVVKYNYLVSDANGNDVPVCIKYSGKDNIAPVPVVSTLPVLKGDCAVTVTAPTATDNCVGMITGTTADPLVYNTQGTYVITWFYNDGNGNVTTQLQTIIVRDETAPVPVLTALPVVTGQCSAVVTTVPKANDACTGVVTGTTTDPLSYTAQGTYTVKWKFTDIYGNSSYQDQTVIVKDNIAPVPVVASLPTVSAECSAGVVIKTGSGCNDDCRCCRNGCHCRTSNCRCRDYEYKYRGVISILFNLLDYYFNWNDEDHECDRDEVADQVLTSITTPTATDNCKGTIVATTTDPLVYTTQGTHIIHWTFNDGNGNITVQEQRIVVKDITAPEPTTRNLPTISGFCSVTVSSKPTAKDNCAGLITATTNDPLTYSNPGTYTIRWNYADGHGNTATQTQTVIVKDPVPPVPTVLVLPTVSGNCSVTVTGVPTAKDNCDGILQGTTNDPLTYNRAGVYTIRWTYSDGRNTVTQNQTVVVKDNVAPVPQVSNLPAVAGACAVVITTVPKATDNCAGVINGTTTSPLIYTVKGAYTIVWKYDDGNGNVTTQNQQVTVSDAIAPVITAPANTTAACGTSIAPEVTGTASASDNCSVSAITYTDVVSNNIITRTWKATDPSGNSATAVQRITLTDNIQPVVTAPANAVVSCNGSTSPSATGTATATDNCGTPSLSYSDIKVAGVITRTWKATDAFGNQGVAVQTITIQDNIKPVVKCPGNVTISCGASTLPNSCGGFATAKDNCDDSPVISYTDVMVGNTITRTWKATDEAGNEGTCTQTITIVDNVKPVLTEPNDITVGCNSSTAPEVTGMATATDNCSAVTITYTDITSGNLITRTWRATDASGNFVTDVQKITVGAAFSPAITSVPSGNTYTGGVSTNLYLGYGAQATTLQMCTLPSAGAPYTYNWTGNAANRLNSTSSSAPVFTPLAAGSYTFVASVTNRFGCTFATSITICVTDIRVPGTNGSKIYICHTTGGKFGTSQTLQVSVNAVPAHVNNSCGGNGSDRLGSCDQTPCNTGSGAYTTQAKQGVTQEMAVTETQKVASEEPLAVTVMPNPSTTYFTLKLASRSKTPVNLRVLDGTGRVVDAKSGLDGNATLQVGHAYSSGTYYAEFLQGTTRKVVQLIKARG